MIKRVRKDLGALLVLILFISTLSATILQFVKGNLFQQALAGNASELSRSIVLVVALVAIELLFFWKLLTQIKTKHFIISHLTPEAFVEFFDEKIDFSELVVKKDRQYD
ncbi:hypothetical protein OfM1_16820 [Lactovum odontotermitis]